jgi:hypothetical protein
MVKPMTILDHRTLNTKKGATIPFYKVFDKGKIKFHLSEKMYLHSSSRIQAIGPSTEKG